MSNVLKTALAGYNAITDTNPNHFSLFVDNEVDHVLIKESTRGSVSINNGGSENIAHGLSGVPFCLVFAEVSAGEWRKVLGRPIDLVGHYFVVDSTNLSIYNDSGGTVSYKYYIFYDRVST